MAAVDDLARNAPAAHEQIPPEPGAEDLAPASRCRSAVSSRAVEGVHWEPKPSTAGSVTVAL
ncbi:hypothetical protein SAMN02982929_01985 [Saccharopolyspora kobensis]|uniref:Uncharacterized protein n=1 Tax=Saccharopolyspora kobensis TaxID=146035 RepID=A0A1H5ZSP3_9PSEU|nr:hypothetical protein [Saccharopolyspora kobensis]SEG39553.1 hypothetical protein SAMN02982929_01985 [Saccharopolyspora kobensis]SFE13968.1 hypothetical protein SAMN05216506_10946 [Saccharopolyspora kobensis]